MWTLSRSFSGRCADDLTHLMHMNKDLNKANLCLQQSQPMHDLPVTHPCFLIKHWGESTTYATFCLNLEFSSVINKDVWSQTFRLVCSNLAQIAAITAKILNGHTEPFLSLHAAQLKLLTKHRKGVESGMHKWLCNRIYNIQAMLGLLVCYSLRKSTAMYV